MQPINRAGLVGLVGSRSYVIALDPPARQTLLTRVGTLFDDHCGGKGVLELPYVAECFRSDVRRPAATTTPHPNTR